ncbi:type II secretion system inner membrane protein GspF [Comamonas piscis]|uniref:Type II secretion system inner membrane protein GspF n=1 Tax=Comamonas piscis TaxID=1562974 RepID=A0A7G5EEQ3_9BURK|nr:type II secretion system inner membrane protein GspF [Comamonas piscis]QMV72478.1 type II secretion system inner membrane protein GspF [Comamonas piscis]WSO35248.1 type II secretion system inner membrane protein GspF [Comamonas piscis]
MPAFSYEVLDAQGQTRKGMIEADSAKAARSLLRAQAMVPLAVEPLGDVDDSGASMVRSRRAVFNATSLAVWTRQLAGLISSGLPLERALTALIEEIDSEPQRQLVASLRAEVNGGSTFAKSLALYPRDFSQIYRAVIDAGEHSGHLDQVLSRLADDLEERDQLKNSLIGASLYPAIVTCFAFVVVMVLMSYVVPQVAEVFSGTKHALPLLTRIMLGFSDLIRHWWWLGAGLAFVGTVMLRLSLRQPAFRQRFDAGWLQLPVVGKLARNYNAARFASTLAMLSNAGVPILKALQAAAETVSNQAMRQDAIDALDQVREGAPLASALAQKKRFPALLSMFARLGEQTGELPQMLQRVANQLAGDVKRRAMRLATILEPLLIVGMGIVVGIIVMAVLMPIIQLNQFVR